MSFPIKHHWNLPLQQRLALLVALVFLCVFAGHQATATDSPRKTCPELVGDTTDLKSAIQNEYEWSILKEGMQKLRRILPLGAHPRVDTEILNRVTPTDDRFYRGVDGVSNSRWQLALNEQAQSFHWGPYSRPRYKRLMRPDQVIDELFIATHVTDSKVIHGISPDLTFSWLRARWRRSRVLTEQLLQTPEFLSIPRLMLVNDDFPPSRQLLSQATQVQWSTAGEFSGEIPYARTVHLAGEQFNACMRFTLRSLGRRFFRPEAPDELRIVLHAHHILYEPDRSSMDFSGTENNRLLNVGQQILDGKEDPRSLAEQALTALVKTEDRDLWTLTESPTDVACFLATHPELPGKSLEFCVNF